MNITSSSESPAALSSWPVNCVRPTGAEEDHKHNGHSWPKGVDKPSLRYRDFTYRLEANNFDNFHACGIRYRYNSYVIDNDESEIKQNCYTTATSAAFKVRGTF